MPAESIMLRFFADMTNINSRQLRRGYVHNSQWGTVIEAVATIGNAPLFIDDQPDITPAEIRAKARRLKAEHDLGLLIVDYIQLVRVPGGLLP
jgi:replicative DNA helicase